MRCSGDFTSSLGMQTRPPHYALPTHRFHGADSQSPKDSNNSYKKTQVWRPFFWLIQTRLVCVYRGISCEHSVSKMKDGCLTQRHICVNTFRGCVNGHVTHMIPTALTRGARYARTTQTLRRSPEHAGGGSASGFSERTNHSLCVASTEGCYF